MAIETEGLLMAVIAVRVGPLRHQPMLRYKKGAMVAHHTLAAVTVLTIGGFEVFVLPVISPGG